MLSSRNRHIHKSDLENVCKTLEIHIELISLRSNGENRVEHYGKGHYFINDCTELTSYCLDHYEEIKDIKDCNKINRGINGKFKRGNDRVIEAFQGFKVLIENVDKLIIPMEMTDEVLNTQFYDTVGDYKTLEYNQKNCRLEEYVEKR